MQENFVETFCKFGMCLTCVQPSSAAFNDSMDESAEKLDGYTYVVEWLNDVDFIIRGYFDGVQVDEVSGSVGAETMLAKEFNEQGDLIKEETVTVSDIIKPAPQEVVNELHESGLDSQIMPMNYDTYAGYVQYRIYRGSGYDYNNLYIFYDIVDSDYVSEYELHADSGRSLGWIVGGILVATGVAIPEKIMGSIIAAMGGVIMGTSITVGTQGYFKGTLYDCNLEAESRVTTPYVTKHYSGKAFDGMIKEGQYGAWESGKAYEGYYPQFIREHDTAVATWLFNDFFEGSFNVNRWESEI